MSLEKEKSSLFMSEIDFKRLLGTFYNDLLVTQSIYKAETTNTVEMSSATQLEMNNSTAFISRLVLDRMAIDQKQS